MAAPELSGFRLLEPIAQGGLSTVWRARHASGLTAAVKVLRQFGTPEEADRFRNEIRAVAGLSHPGIVRVLDLGHSDSEFVLPDGQRVRKGTPWLAMEYVGGGTLTPGHVRDWTALAYVARSLLEALAHAHARGVVHRDLKPPNVLLADARDPLAGLKLTDFGIAWTRPDSPEHGPTGTLDYMAPEQIEVQVRRYGPWTDLYGLGCLLYEIATGAPPFRDQPDRPLAIAHLVAPPPPLRTAFDRPEAFEAWIERMLAKEPHDRFASAAEALEALFGPAPTPIVRTAGWSPSGAGLRLFGLREIPLVGREPECAALTAAQEDTGDGPIVVVLRGPSGVGRSRLLRWVHETTTERGTAFSVPVRPVEGGNEVEVALLARLGGTGLEGPELQEHLDWWSGPDVGADLRREFAQVLAPPVGRRVDTATRAAGVARWLGAVAARRRVAWLVDDAGDCPEAVEVALELLRDPARPPALVVVAVSDDAPVPADSALAKLVQQARDVRLEALSRDDRLVLLQRALTVEPALAARIDEETGGSMLQSIELLRDQVERGWLVPGPEGLRLAPGREVVVPSDRLAPWVSRLQRVVGGDDAVGIQLELAAALGEEVPSAAWEAVGGAEHAEARRELLDDLLSARLAEPLQNGFRFAHPMARNAVLRQARMFGRFKAAHRTCLLWAQATGASAERIARHLVALEDWEQAVGPLLDATEHRHHAEGPGAGWTTLQMAEQAIERAGIRASDPRSLRARVLQAMLLLDQGRPDQALEVLDALGKALDARGARAERLKARMVRAECLAATGAFDEALELHRANEAVRDGLDEALRIRTCDALTRICIRLGRYKEAAAWAHKAEALLARAGSEGLRGVNLLHQAGIAARRDDLPGAQALLQRAQPLVEEFGSLQQRAILMNERAALTHRTGSADRAEPLFERAIELFRAAGYKPLWPSINLAICKLERRRVDEAEGIVQESGAQSGPPESGPVTAASLVLAACHAQRGRWSAFDRALDKAEIGLLTHAEPDNVALLERAAQEAFTQGQVSRGERCRALVRDQRARMKADE